jgi:hypothetical protein
MAKESFLEKLTAPFHISATSFKSQISIPANVKHNIMGPMDWDAMLEMLKDASMDPISFFEAALRAVSPSMIHLAEVLASDYRTVPSFLILTVIASLAGLGQDDSKVLITLLEVNYVMILIIIVK